MPVPRPRQRVPPRHRRLPGQLGTARGHPGDPHGGDTNAITPFLYRAAGITRRVPSVTSANPATMAMPPGAPRVTASPVPATDPMGTPSRCHSTVCHIPEDTDRVSPVPLSPPQGDQDLLRGHGRAAHVQCLCPGAQRAPLREVTGTPGWGGKCFWGERPSHCLIWVCPTVGACPGTWGTRYGESHAEVSVTGRGPSAVPCGGTKGGCG